MRHGVDGFLYSPGDSVALAEFLSDLASKEGALEELQASIRPVFTISQHVEYIVELYKSLATGIECL